MEKKNNINIKIKANNLMGRGEFLKRLGGGRDGSGIGRVRQERRIDVGDVGRGADRQDDLSRQQGEG